MTAGFIVKEAYALATLQDLGRPNYHNMGISSSGALDQFAYLWSNRLLDNPINSSSIEICTGQFTLEAERNTVISVCGADLNFTIDNQRQPLWQTINLQKGQILRWQGNKSGQICYLSVVGGFQVHPHFGSVSTNIREKIGGLKADGQPLKIADKIPYKAHPTTISKTLSPAEIPSYPKEQTLRVITGYQYDQFSVENKTQFFNEIFNISNQYDRMGFRLTGTKISHKIPQLQSEGISKGAIQIPGNGQPIIMMNDHPTIGGYAKIGTLFSLDLAKLSQLGRDDVVRFTKIPIKEAQSLRYEYNTFFGI